MTNVLHVTPQHDLVDRDTSNCEPDCACGPEVRPATQEDGSMGWLLVHHPLDGREQAGRQACRPSPPEGQGVPAG